MSKAVQKTMPGTLSADALLHTLEDVQQLQDGRRLIELMSALTGESPVVWGESIIGFGQYAYTYASGRSGISYLTGFSIRKKDISIYTNIYLAPEDPLLKTLGKFRHGKSCLYVRRLSDIRLDVLEKLVRFSVAKLREMHP
jgi:hypothetical protein